MQSSFFSIFSAWTHRLILCSLFLTRPILPFSNQLHPHCKSVASASPSLLTHNSSNHGILNTFIPYQDDLIGIKWKWCKSHFLLLLKPLTHTQQAVKWATWLPWWTIAVISSVLKHDNITVCYMRATDVITCYYLLLYHWCFCHCQIIWHNLGRNGG